MKRSRKAFSTTRHVVFLMVLLVFGAVSALAGTQAGPPKNIIIRGSAAKLQTAKALLGAAVLETSSGDGLLLALPSNIRDEDLGAIEAELGVEIEGDQPVSMPRTLRSRLVTTRSRPQAAPSVGSYYGSPAPDQYVNQPAAIKLQIREALGYATGRRAVVAIIDTGVDPNHPVLKDSLLPGQNYVVPGSAPYEWNDYTVNQSSEGMLLLDQSSEGMLLLDQSSEGMLLLDQSSEGMLLLDQSSEGMLLLDQSSEGMLLLDSMPAAFGHGTMVAGMVHLVAPEALILPMKAFDANGSTTVWRVSRAIYDAVRYGADVINLSFSGSTDSRLLRGAIEFAHRHGVLVVASAGNNNVDTPTYPASLSQAIAVTSLTLEDAKAGFSNYGSYVDVSGPGVNMLTTYPGGRFAMVSGTSFTPPLIAGALALLRERGETGDAARHRIEKGVDNVAERNPAYGNQLGQGRINLLKAIQGEGEQR